MGVPDEVIKEQIAAMNMQFGPVSGDLTEDEQLRLKLLFKALVILRTTQGERGREFVEGLMKEIEEKFQARAKQN